MTTDKNYIGTGEKAGKVDFDYIPYNPLIAKNAEDIANLRNQGKPIIHGYREDNITVDDNIPYFVKEGVTLSYEYQFTEFAPIEIGRGKNTYSGFYITVDSTNIIVKRYWESEQIIATVPHNLNMTSFLKILFSMDEVGKLTIVLQTLGGQFKYDATTNYAFIGQFFASNIDGDTRVAFSGKDFQKNIWCFGDSYFGVNSSRWPYYIMDWTKKLPLMCALSGGNSSRLLADLKRCLKFGAPQCIFWCLGMNDGNDNANAPSATWLSAIQEVISICEREGIVPILATIPTVPTVNNEKKSEWVRNSGYRYVDFAKAVGSNADGSWYDGYLSSDNVHPDILGGQALAMQILFDFPEIAGID